jgi:ubiquinone/menaquinone biosynthesis C-methylase UbiE
MSALSNTRFDAIATQYDVTWDSDGFAKFVVECLDKLPWATPYFGQRALDVGCGTGAFSMQLRHRCKSIIGLDPSPGMLSVFQEKIEQQGLSHMSVCHANLLDESQLLPAPLQQAGFDFVCSLLAFHHIRDGAQMVKALRALMTPGARLLIVDYEETGNSKLLHPRSMQLGVDYEYDGVNEVQMRSWLDGLDFEQPAFARFSFRACPEPGHGVDVSESQEFSLIALTAVLPGGALASRM